MRPHGSNQDDSDIQYLNEVNRLEESYLRKRLATNTSVINESITSLSSSQKKRKETEEEGGGLDIAEITSFQSTSKRRSIKNENNESDDDVIVDLVKPVSSKQVSGRALFKTNSFSGASNSNRSQPKSSLDESVQIIPLNHPRGYSYKFDGLGGRQKIFKSGESDSSSSNIKTTATTSNGRFFRFKS